MFLDLGALLDSCSWYDIGNFLQTCIKTHCCRLNQLKNLQLTLIQYVTMHVAILDHIRHLNCDLSRSLKVKCDGVLDLSFQNLNDFDIDLSR